MGHGNTDIESNRPICLTPFDHWSLKTQTRLGLVERILEESATQHLYRLLRHFSSINRHYQTILIENIFSKINTDTNIADLLSKIFSGPDVKFMLFKELSVQPPP